MTAVLHFYSIGKHFPFFADNEEVWSVILQDRLARGSAVTQSAAAVTQSAAAVTQPAAAVTQLTHQGHKRKWNEAFLMLPASASAAAVAEIKPGTPPSPSSSSTSTIKMLLKAPTAAAVANMCRDGSPR